MKRTAAKPASERSVDGRAGRDAPPLSNEQLVEMLSLIRGADSVELKLSVPDRHQRPAADALGMDPLDAQVRQVVFFDTPDLQLNQHGVVVRARRIQRKPSDSVVKLRPVVPGDLPPKFRGSDGLTVEVDAMPGGFVCSASMKATGHDDAKAKEVFTGRRSLRSLFNGEQRKFFKAFAPPGIRLDELTTLGPINVLKLKFTPSEYPRPLVAELWLYPDGSRILELSTKCAPHEAFQVAAETKAFLAQHGISLHGEQQTKTKAALEFFASEAAAAT